jgi:membrane associated rhomboid family serine protease
MYSEFTFGRELKPGIKIISLICTAIFICSFLPGISIFIEHLVLKPLGVEVWQNITYMFVHTSALHFFGNILSLVLIGRAVEMRMGNKEFIIYFLICGLGGAITTHLIALTGGGGYTLGASGAIFGVFYACYYYYPDQVLHFNFIFPIKLKWLLLFMGAFDLIMLFSAESRVAHYAHLGGLLTGIAYMRYANSFNQWKVEKKHLTKLREEKEVIDMKLQVDDILDKINKQGMGALSEQEIKFLKNSSKQYKDKQAKGNV